MDSAPILDREFLEKLERLALRWQKSFPGLVGGQLLQAFRRAAYVGQRASGSLDMDANAGRADRHGDVHPFLAARDGFVEMGGIGIVQAAADAGGDVHDVRMGLLDRAPEFVQVGWLGGWKMPAEGLDVMDAK